MRQYHSWRKERRAYSEDVRWVTLSKQEVDDIQESLEVSILEVLAHADERSRYPARYTDRVLNVQVRFDAGLARALRVAAAVEGLQREGRADEVGAQGAQHGLQVRAVGELLDEAGDTEGGGGLCSLGGRDAVERLETCGCDGTAAGGGNGTRG